MNLPKLLSLIAGYKLIPFDTVRKRTMAEINSMLDEAGSVWQKFAQSLSLMEFMLGRDICKELEGLYCDCTPHSHEYSKTAIAADFGDKYDIDSMQYVASGSVAQTYRIIRKSDKTEVCCKVMHPDADDLIMSACDIYESVKDSYFFPASLGPFCKLFFKSLKTQVNMHLEYDTGLKYWHMLQKNNIYNPDGSPSIVTPKMMECSGRCIVMEYMPGESVMLSNYETFVERYGAISMTRFTSITSLYLNVINIGNGLLHIDMHPGNIGIAKHGENVNVIVYDMGQFYINDPADTDMAALGIIGGAALLNGDMYKLVDLGVVESKKSKLLAYNSKRVYGAEFRAQADNFGELGLSTDGLLSHFIYYNFLLAILKCTIHTSIGVSIQSDNMAEVGILDAVIHDTSEDDRVRILFTNCGYDASQFIDTYIAPFRIG